MEGASEFELFRDREMDFFDAVCGSEESQWQVKERDPSATLGQYGEAEKLEDDGDESAALYHVWFKAEGECELLPADKTRVLSTQPVKKQETKE